MKNATIIYGSPRGKNSATYKLGNRFSFGLKKAEYSLHEIFLKDMQIKNCTGCYSCWTKTPGKCVLQDDMKTLYPLLQVDIVIYCIPLYWYSVPGNVKSLIDRQLPFLKPYLVENNGSTRHDIRDNVVMPKNFLISAAGFPEQEHFDWLISYFKKIWGERGYLGELVVAGAEMLSREGAESHYHDILDQTEKMGYEIGSTGEVENKTAQEVSQILNKDDNYKKRYRQIANQYWTSLQHKENRDNGKMQDNLLKLSPSNKGFGGFVAGMAAQYNPDAVKGFEGIIQFLCDGEYFFLHIDDAKCSAYKGKKEYDLFIDTPSTVWYDIAEKKLSGSKALFDGLYKAEGDIQILQKMSAMFGVEEEDQNTASDYSDVEKSATSQTYTKRGPLRIKGMLWSFGKAISIYFAASFSIVLETVFIFV